MCIPDKESNGDFDWKQTAEPGRASDPTHIAVHYLCLSRLRHEKPAEAQRIVREA